MLPAGQTFGGKNMTIENLGNIGEFVSGLAVVVSLLYVAYELRSSTRTVRASSAALSQDSLASINDLLASNPELAGIWARAGERGTLEGLKPDEALRVVVFLRANMQRFESMYFRYEAGLLEERIWKVRREWLAGFLLNPLVAEWWRTDRDSSLFTPDFIADLECVDGVPLDWSGQRRG